MPNVKKVDVLIKMEHPVREFDISCILAVILEKVYGRTTGIESMMFRDYETLCSYEPKVLAVPYLLKNDAGFDRFRKYWPNAVFANLAYEQVFQKVNRNFKSPAPYMATPPHFYNAWGQFYVEYLKERGVPEDVITVNGNPSYSLYREPYRRGFASKEELAKRHGLDPNKRWVFIPENYQSAFFSEARVQGYIEAGEQEREIREFIAFGENSLKAVCEWVKDVPEGVEVILRPRPATEMSIFRAKVDPWLAGASKNLHVTNEDTVREWILASDAVASSYSTTMLEAAIANKPVFMLKPYPYPPQVMNDWYEHVDEIKNKPDWIEVMNGQTEKGDWRKLEAYARGVMMVQDDPIASMAEWLNRIIEFQEGRTPIANESEMAKLRSKCNMRRINRAIRKVLFRQKEKSRMHDYFTQEEVEKSIAKWRRVIEQA